MPLAIPAELKKISPYVRRAEELDKDKGSPESRLVAYYCRQYAVHVGIPLSGTSAAAKTCLGHLLENLETEKPAMDNFTRDESAFLCRKFANKVFDKADEEDRAGAADKNTAKTFYAASTFLQILDQFATGENAQAEEHAEDRKRIVYAKWKSTEILKAIKEGRTPTPGGYQDQADEAMGDDEDDNEAEEKKLEKKQDAPAVVETVKDDEGEEGQEVFVPPPVPLAPPGGLEVQTPITMDEEPEETGTEVELGPPPAYPGPSVSDSASPSSSFVDKPKISFDLPPVVQPAPLPAPTPTKKPGLFGGFKKKQGAGKASKAQIADAVELTRFALAALEDKDAELGAERLRQALEVLGR